MTQDFAVRHPIDSRKTRTALFLVAPACRFGLSAQRGKPHSRGFVDRRVLLGQHAGDSGHSDLAHMRHQRGSVDARVNAAPAAVDLDDLENFRLGDPTSVRGPRALGFDFDSVLELLSEPFQDTIRFPAEHLTSGSGPDSFSVLGCGRPCRGNLIA